MVAPMVAMAAAQFGQQMMGDLTKPETWKPGMKFQSLFEPIVIFIRGLVRLFINFIKAIPKFIIQLQLFLWASISLGVVLGVLVVFFVIVYIVHPRPFFVNRYSNVDRFKDKFMQDLLRCMDIAVRRRPPAQYVDAANDMQYNALSVLAYGNFDTNLDVYLKFHDTIQNIAKSPLYRTAGGVIFKNAGIFVTSEGDFSPDEMTSFVQRFVQPFEAFCAGVRSLRNAIAETRASSDLDRESYTFVGAVYELDVLLNDYMPVAKTQLAMRKGATSKLNFLIFERYYVPLVNDMFVNGVINSFKAAGKMFLNIFIFLDNMWGEVGMFISRIPCMVAPDYKDKCKQLSLGIKVGKLEYYTDYRKNAREAYQKECTRGGKSQTAVQEPPEKPVMGISESFSQDDEARVLEHYDKPMKEDSSPTDVIEHFGSLFSLARSVGSFFSNFAPLGLQLVKYGKDFTKDPFRSIMGWFMILVAPIIGMIMLWWYAMWSLPFMLGCSAIWFWFFITDVVIIILYLWYSMLARLFIVIVLFFFFIGVWILDQLSNGMILRILQCEDDPDSPENRINYADGNGYKRFVLGCMYPCFKGYMPRPLLWMGNNPILCKRHEKSRPNMCPEQQLLRFFRGKSLVKPYMYDEFKPQLYFKLLNTDARIKEIRETYKKRQEYLKGCNRSLNGRFGHIARHVCTNISNQHFASEDEKNVVLKLCSQLYCEGSSHDGAVCEYLDRENGKVSDVRLGEAPMEILGRSFMVAIAAMIVLVAAMALIRAAHMRSTALNELGNVPRPPAA